MYTAPPRIQINVDWRVAVGALVVIAILVIVLYMQNKNGPVGKGVDRIVGAAAREAETKEAADYAAGQAENSDDGWK